MGVNSSNHNYRRLIINPSYLILGSASNWYDFNLGTASSYVDDRNTIAGALSSNLWFTRIWDKGDFEYHLYSEFSNDYLKHKYDGDKLRHVGEFDGWPGSNGMYSTNSGISTNNTITQFTVFKTPPSFGLADSYLFSKIDESIYTHQLIYDDVNGKLVQLHSTIDGGGLFDLKSGVSISITASNWYLTVSTFSNIGTSSVSDVYLKCNGIVATGSRTVDPGLFGSSGTFQSISMYDGYKFAEIIQYHYQLTPTEISNIENYLKYKWSISY